MRILEFLQDEINGKLSNNKLITTLLGLTSIGITIYLTITNSLTSEYNILIGILVSGAIGNRFIGNSTRKESTTNIDTQKQ